MRYHEENGWVVLADAPESRSAGRLGRVPPTTPPGRNLDDNDLRLIGSLAGQGRTLREIAAAVGVSHETVRAVVRQASMNKARV